MYINRLRLITGRKEDKNYDNVDICITCFWCCGKFLQKKMKSKYPRPHKHWFTEACEIKLFKLSYYCNSIDYNIKCLIALIFFTGINSSLLIRPTEILLDNKFENKIASLKNYMMFNTFIWNSYIEFSLILLVLVWTWVFIGVFDNCFFFIFF